MTNGEKIKAILEPRADQIRINGDWVEIEIQCLGINFSCELSWWNAEYKEPTTKNEAKYCDRNICLKNEYNNVGCEDCEVTKSQESTTKNELAYNLCNSCTNTGCKLKSVIAKTACAFYIPPHLELDNCGNYVIQKPTTKIDIINDFDDFIEFGKKAFGVELTVKKSDNPDTYEKLFGTTKNDLVVDAVSREAVTELVSSQRLDTFSDEGRKWANIKIDVILRGLKELPPATPIRPKGRWIGHREHCENLGVMPSGLGAYEWCSNCDCGIDVREWHRNHYNYCPNCGADMREAVEE